MNKLKLFNMNRKNIIAVTAIIIILAVAFTVMLILVLQNNEEEKFNYDNQIIVIKVQGELFGEYTYQKLTELSQVVEFKAKYKPSTLPSAIEKTYSGIYLKDLLEKLEISLEDKSYIKFKAVDNVEKSYTINDIKDAGNVYIAYLVNGKPFNKGIDSLAHTKPEEDGGPFVVIKAKDAYSQDRVKLLVEINIE